MQSQRHHLSRLHISMFWYKPDPGGRQVDPFCCTVTAWSRSISEFSHGNRVQFVKRMVELPTQTFIQPGLFVMDGMFAFRLDQWLEPAFHSRFQGPGKRMSPVDPIARGSQYRLVILQQVVQIIALQRTIEKGCVWIVFKFEHGQRDNHTLANDKQPRVCIISLLTSCGKLDNRP